MRILFASIAAIALSGCSWLGLGGNNHNYNYNKSANTNQSACCAGGKTLARWNMEAGVGPEFITGGDIVSGGDTHPGIAALGLGINNVSQKNAYNTGVRAELGGSYALNPNRKITAQGFYAKADGKDMVWGSQGANELRGTMSDYKSYGAELGLRQYALPTRFPVFKSVRPYVEGKLGAAYINDIRLENIREVGVDAPNPQTPTSLGFYEGGWVPTGAALIGVETPVAERFTMGIETGVRYVGAPQSDGTDFGVSGSYNSRYAGANNAGSRWSIPLTIRGRYRF